MTHVCSLLSLPPLTQTSAWTPLGQFPVHSHVLASIWSYAMFNKFFVSSLWSSCFHQHHSYVHWCLYGNYQPHCLPNNQHQPQIIQCSWTYSPVNSSKSFEVYALISPLMTTWWWKCYKPTLSSCNQVTNEVCLMWLMSRQSKAWWKCTYIHLNVG